MAEPTTRRRTRWRVAILAILAALLPAAVQGPAYWDDQPAWSPAGP